MPVLSYSGRRLSGLLLSGVVLSVISLTAQNDRVLISQLLRTYAQTGRVGNAVFENAERFTSGLEVAVRDWVAEGPATDATRRSRVASLLSLEIVRANSGRGGGNDRHLIEWSCDRLRTDPTSHFEQLWMRASSAILQAAALEIQGSVDRSVAAHLHHGLGRFPSDARLRLMELLLRAEIVALSNRPGLRRDWLVRHFFERNPRAATDPARIEISLRDLRALRSDPEVGPEALTHIALLHFHLNELESAAAEAVEAAERSSEPFVRNLAWLVGGLALDWNNRPMDAAVAYAKAASAMPLAKASAVASAARQFVGGNRLQAASTIEMAYGHVGPVLDPWQHIAGDARFVPDWMEKLRMAVGVPLDSKHAPVGLDPNTTSPASSASSALQLPNRSAASLQGTSRPLFRTETVAVAVDVDVKSKRVPVIGLGPNDFELLDNGVAQKIRDISLEPMPLDVSLVLDLETGAAGASGPQHPDSLRAFRLQKDVPVIKGQLGSQDRLRILKVGSESAEIVPLQANPEIPLEKLDRHPNLRSYHRYAALYDALASVLVRNTPPDRRHVVVLFTEGVDDASVLRPDDLYRVADVADAVLYTVRHPTLLEDILQRNGRAGSFPPYSRNFWPPEPTVVEEAARRTGGRVIPNLGGSVAEHLRTILDRFRQTYVLRYEPEGVPRDGWHKITVSVRKPGRFDITARRGYFGGMN